MSVVIDSATTNYFDFSVGYNYYTRQTTINDTSSYKAGGAALVSPIQYTLTSPSGITSSGTITPSAPVALVKNMGLFGTGIEYGTYTVDGTFTDQDGTTYPLTKTTILCPPVQCTPKNAANGCVDLSWTVRCIDNVVVVADTTTFELEVNGETLTGSVTYGITVINPNAVVLASAVTVPYFQITPVVNGAYWISVDDTAVYTVGDGVTVTVHYILVKTQYKAQCDINLCEVQCAVNDVYNQWLAVEGTGSQTEKTLYYKWQQLSLLIGLTQIAIMCGGDTSTLLTQIETLSGVSCSCSCGTTSVNAGAGVDPNQTIVLQSGGGDIVVSQTTVGLTTTWTIEDLSYVVAIANDGSQTYLSVTNATVGNTKTYTISFDAGAFNNVIDNTTTAVPNSTTAAETLMSQAIALNTLSVNEGEINWEASYTMVGAAAKLIGTMNVTINGQTLYTKTIAALTVMANKIVLQGKIVRPSNTTAYAYTTATYYNLGEFVSQEINILPTSLAGTWNWTTTGYTLLVRTTQATVNIIQADYLSVKVFRPI